MGCNYLYLPLIPTSRTTLLIYRSEWTLQWRHNEYDGVSNHQPVYSTIYSGAVQRKHQSSASLAFVRGIHRWPVRRWPVTGARASAATINLILPDDSGCITKMVKNIGISIQHGPLFTKMQCTSPAHHWGCSLRPSKTKDIVFFWLILPTCMKVIPLAFEQLYECWEMIEIIKISLV